MISAIFEKAPSRTRENQKSFSCLTLAACAWVGLFPLLHFGTYTTLTRDKWIIMFLLIIVTVLCSLIDGIQHRLAKPAKLPLLLGGLLLGWMILSCARSEFDVDTWWIGGSARREGLMTQLCYLLLFFCFSCAQINPTHILRSAAFGVIAFFLIVLLQRAGGNPFGLYPERTSYALNPEFQGTIGNTDMGTGYLCLMIGMFLSYLLRMISRRSHYPGNSISPAALPGGQPRNPVSFSSFKNREVRSGLQKSTSSPGSFKHHLRLSAFSSPEWRTRLFCLLGLVLSVWLLIEMDIQFGIISLCAMILGALLSFVPRRARLPVLLMLLILVLLLVWFWPGSSGGLWELHEILHERPQLSFGHNRIAVWQYSLSLAGERLFLGGGSDTFEQRFNSWLRENNAVIPTHQGKTLLPAYFDNPHNEYLAHLVNHGLPALGFFLALILIALFHPRARHSCFRLAIFGYAIQAFFSFSVCIVAPIFWVLLGLCCADTKET